VQGAAFGAATYVRGAVESWLRARPGRRILILLDEADAFIEADARAGFGVIRQLKGLMDATHYAFKLVLTGLHNVQRVSQDNNAPIPHLGEAVAIGPLHGRDEAREAWRLVTEPFTARGFSFDPPDLPITILARANYYPSLIQLICSRIIESLDRSEIIPPHTLTEADLRQRLEDPSLHERLRQHFELTIGLDPRYQLLALCLALHSIDEPEDSQLVNGFDEGWFARQAIDLWPDGFPDRPLGKVVGTLLQEMAKLGVLAERDHPEGPHYVLLRSGLRSLLGSRKQISDQLAGFIGRPPPAPYTPGSFRRRLGEGESDPRRSPFSSEDERRLFAPENGVVVVLGSKLTGMNDAVRAIKAACPPENARVEVETPSGGLSVPDWVISVLRRAAEEDRFEGVTALLVNWQVGWSSDLPLIAARHLGRSLDRTRLIRIAFLGGPVIAWRWGEQARVYHANSSGARIREITLQPWGQETLRRWAEEIGVPGRRDEIGLNQIRELTGGFGPVLAAYAENPPRQAEAPQDFAARLLSAIGLSLDDWPMEPKSALAALAGIMVDPAKEDFTIDDLQSAAEIPSEVATHIVEWAAPFGFLAEVLAGRYRLNPFLAQALSRPGD
jgi:hypothetical protein